MLADPGLPRDQIARAGSASAGLTAWTVWAKTVSPARSAEGVGLGAGQLGGEPLAGVGAQVDPHLEAEPHDALDARLDDPGRPADPGVELPGPLTAAVQRDVVRTHELPAEPRHRAEERHDEVVGRPVVEATRGHRPARSGPC